MKNIELENTFDVSFSYKESATSATSHDCTISVDISGLSAADIREWMCNNGIVVYLQGRVRAGKLNDGDTYKLHSPGTRSVTTKILEGEQLTKARTFLAAIGKPDALTGTAQEVSEQFHAVRRALDKIKRESK